MDSDERARPEQQQRVELAPPSAQSFTPISASPSAGSKDSGHSSLSGSPSSCEPQVGARNQLESLYLACVAAEAAMECRARPAESSKATERENERTEANELRRRRRPTVSRRLKLQGGEQPQPQPQPQQQQQLKTRTPTTSATAAKPERAQAHEPMNLSAAGNAAFCSALNEHLARLHQHQRSPVSAASNSAAGHNYSRGHAQQHHQVPFLYSHNQHHGAGVAADPQLQASLQFASLHSLSAVATALQNQQQQQQQQQSATSATSQYQPNHGADHSRPLDSMVLALANQLHAGQAAAAVGQLGQLPTAAQPGRRGRRRGQRKCRKVYGMEQRSLWCTQCKWKKACSRFCDHRAHSQLAAAGLSNQLSQSYQQSRQLIAAVASTMGSGGASSAAELGGSH